MSVRWFTCTACDGEGECPCPGGPDCPIDCEDCEGSGLLVVTDDS